MGSLSISVFLASFGASDGLYDKDQLLCNLLPRHRLQVIVNTDLDLPKGKVTVPQHV